MLCWNISILWKNGLQIKIEEKLIKNWLRYNNKNNNKIDYLILIFIFTFYNDKGIKKKRGIYFII